MGELLARPDCRAYLYLSSLALASTRTTLGTSRPKLPIPCFLPVLPRV